MSYGVDKRWEKREHAHIMSSMHLNAFLTVETWRELPLHHSCAIPFRSIGPAAESAPPSTLRSREHSYGLRSAPAFPHTDLVTDSKPWTFCCAIDHSSLQVLVPVHLLTRSDMFSLPRRNSECFTTQPTRTLRHRFRTPRCLDIHMAANCPQQSAQQIQVSWCNR